MVKKIILIFSLLLCITLNRLYYLNVSADNVVNLYSNQEIFEYRECSDGVELIKYNGNESSVTIPNRYNGMKVVSISDYAFANNDTITEIIVSENGVNKIGEGTFSNMKSLQFVYYPDTLISIGKFAFLDCESLERVVPTNQINTTSGSVYISKYINEIGEGAFSGNNKIDSFYVQSGNAKYGYSERVLYEKDSSNLNTILHSYPNGNSETNYFIKPYVNKINNYAFYKNKKIESIIIPDNVNLIGEYAFYDTNLQTIKLKGEVKTIEQYTFANNNFLKAVDVGMYVETIKHHAFYNCPSLEKVDLSPSLKRVGQYSFSCTGLEYIIFGENVSIVESYALENCPNLLSVRLDGDKIKSFNNLSILNNTATIFVHPNLLDDYKNILKDYNIVSYHGDITEVLITEDTFKLFYYQKETLNTSLSKVIGVTNNGNIEIEINESMIRDFTTENIGIFTMKVLVEGLIYEVNYEVLPPYIVDIFVEEYNSVYVAGEYLNLDDTIMYVVYNNEEIFMTPVLDEYVSDFSTEKIGTYEFNIIFDDFKVRLPYEVTEFIQTTDIKTNISKNVCYVDEVIEFETVIEPSNASYNDAIYSLSDEKLATFDGNKLLTLASGELTVFVSTNRSEIVEEVKLTILDAKIKNTTVVEDKVYKNGDVIELSSEVEGTNYRSLEYRIYNEYGSCVRIISGNEAKSVNWLINVDGGKYNIDATLVLNNGVTVYDRKSISIVVEAVRIESEVLSNEIYTGDKIEFINTIYPYNTTNKDVKIEVENENIIEYVDGKFIAKNVGSTFVNISCGNVSNKIEVKILETKIIAAQTEKYIYLSGEEIVIDYHLRGISFDNVKIEIYKKNTLVNQYYSDDSFKYVIQDYISPGKYTIKLFVDDSELFYESNSIIVNSSITSVELSSSDLSLYELDNYKLEVHVKSKFPVMEDVLFTSANDSIVTVVSEDEKYSYTEGDSYITIYKCDIKCINDGESFVRVFFTESLIEKDCYFDVLNAQAEFTSEQNMVFECDKIFGFDYLINGTNYDEIRYDISFGDSKILENTIKDVGRINIQNLTKSGVYTLNIYLYLNNSFLSKNSIDFYLRGLVEDVYFVTQNGQILDDYLELDYETVLCDGRLDNLQIKYYPEDAINANFIFERKKYNISSNGIEEYEHIISINDFGIINPTYYYGYDLIEIYTIDGIFNKTLEINVLRPKIEIKFYEDNNVNLELFFGINLSYLSQFTGNIDISKLLQINSIIDIEERKIYYVFTHGISYKIDADEIGVKKNKSKEKLVLIEKLVDNFYKKQEKKFEDFEKLIKNKTWDKKVEIETELEACFMFEKSFDNMDEAKFLSGGITLDVGVNLSITKPLLIPILGIPGYLTFDFGTSRKTIINWGTDFYEEKLTNIVTLLSATEYLIDASLGAGAKGLASIGVTGGGSLSTIKETDIYTKQNIFDFNVLVYLEAHLKGFAELLFVKASFDILSIEGYYDFEKNEWTDVMSHKDKEWFERLDISTFNSFIENNYDTNLIERTYLYLETKDFDVENYVKRVNNKINQYAQMLEENVISNNQAKIYNLGNDEKIVLWLDDDGESNTYNFQHLFYSYFDGNSWSIPKQVKADNTLDSSFAAYVYEDKLYLIYDNASEIVDEYYISGNQYDQLQKVYAYMENEICYFDENKQEFITVDKIGPYSKSEELIYDKKFTVVNDSLYLVYSNMNKLDLFGTQEDVNYSIYAKNISNNQEAKKLITVNNQVLDFEYLDNKYCAYMVSEETTNNGETTNQYVVYLNNQNIYESFNYLAYIGINEYQSENRFIIFDQGILNIFDYESNKLIKQFDFSRYNLSNINILSDYEQFIVSGLSAGSIISFIYNEEKDDFEIPLESLTEETVKNYDIILQNGKLYYVASVEETVYYNCEELQVNNIIVGCHSTNEKSHLYDVNYEIVDDNLVIDLIITNLGYDVLNEVQVTILDESNTYIYSESVLVECLSGELKGIQIIIPNEEGMFSYSIILDGEVYENIIELPSRDLQIVIEEQVYNGQYNTIRGYVINNGIDNTTYTQLSIKSMNNLFDKVILEIKPLSHKEKQFFEFIYDLNVLKESLNDSVSFSVSSNILELSVVNNLVNIDIINRDKIDNIGVTLENDVMIVTNQYNFDFNINAVIIVNGIQDIINFDLLSKQSSEVSLKDYINESSKTISITLFEEEVQRSKKYDFNVSYNNFIVIENVEIVVPKTTILLGEEIDFNVVFNPLNSTIQSYSLSTSNSEVINIENGKIIGVKAGETTITATSYDGKECTIKLIVGDDSNNNSDINSNIKYELIVDTSNVELNVEELEDHNVTNLKVYLVGNDGSKQEIKDYQVDFSNVKNKEGEYEIIISYLDYETCYTLNILSGTNNLLWFIVGGVCCITISVGILLIVLKKGRKKDEKNKH
ncbi:MAG: leucine-rich repeat protein [Bacilli bacterium]|nr:leucine-rich repeat protein [Bacilli bacterium]